MTDTPTDKKLSERFEDAVIGALVDDSRPKT
jgi:hypothetical protein